MGVSLRRPLSPALLGDVLRGAPNPVTRQLAPAVFASMLGTSGEAARMRCATHPPASA